MLVKKIFIGCLLVLVTLFVALGIYAQQPTTTQPAQPAAVSQTYHAATPAYTFQLEVATGKTIGDYPFTANTKIVTVVVSDGGAVAMTAHRISGGTGSDQTVVLTRDRVVAKEGDTIDGKRLLRIAPAVLAIANSGHVAYEALYTEGGSGTPRAGVFVERAFAMAFQPYASGDATDFELRDDDKVLMKNLPPPPVKRSWGVTTILRSMERDEYTLLRVYLPRKDWQEAWGWSRVGNDIERGVLSRPPAPAQKPDKTGDDPSAAAQLPTQTKSTCKSGVFPLPHEWKMGADISGPVASHVYEDAPKGTVYDSRIYGRLASPFRTIQYSADCRPLIVTIGDDAAEGRYELHTPAGLLTYKTADGSYAFPGIAAKVIGGPFTRSDVHLRVTRTGQIILPVTLDSGGFALLLATPVSGVN